MPTYIVNFETAEGPRSDAFKIDDDKPLFGQVREIVTELDRRGITINGRPRSTLVARWNGQPLQLGHSPAALGIDTARPIEVMLVDEPEWPLLPPESPARWFLPKNVSAAALQGSLAGVLTWLLLGGVAGEAALTAPSTVDWLLGCVTGAFVGIASATGEAQRRSRSVSIPALGGTLAGAVLGLSGSGVAQLVGVALTEMSTPASPSIARLWAWAVYGSILSGGLSATLSRRVGSALASLVAGLVTSFIAGLCSLLPVPADVSLAAGYLVLGSGVCASVALGSLVGAAGVLELESEEACPVGLTQLRQWEVGPAEVLEIGNKGNPLRIVRENNEWWLSGTARTALRNGIAVDVGPTRYRFRRFPI